MSFEWIVVGAGPAGISTIGLLLDAGVDGRQIGWIDPQFQVGDFGTTWSQVLSNTLVGGFLDVYRASPSFGFDSKRDVFVIEKLPERNRCPLLLAADPLRWVTKGLMERVHPVKDRVLQLKQQDRSWQLALGSGQTLRTRAVVLAFGAQPRRLPFANLPDIPLAVALNPLLIQQHVQETDQLVVFGDAQSARSALQNLSQVKAKKIIHFYRSEESVERHLSDLDMSAIHSLPTTSAHLLQTIPQCTKAIYAIGFERRGIHIDGLPENFGYDEKTGIIAPGVYGAGIAFPETRAYEMGRLEYQVTALRPLMKGLKKRVPKWLAATLSESGWD